MEETAKNPLGTERIGKLMVRFAVPSIIALVINSIYSVVDQIVIGNGVENSDIAIAATNVILPLMMAVMAVGLMIGDGCAAFMGLNMGRGDTKKAARGVGTSVVTTLIFGVLFTILCEALLEPLCWLFGATENSISYCIDYGRPIILGFLFLSIDMAFTSIIRADGRANVSLYGMLIGCITNMILDPIFIFVFKWGVAGAGWATIIGQILNAIYFVICILRCKSVKLEHKDFIPRAKILGKICLLGVSSFITQFALVIVIAVMNNTLGARGAISKFGADIPIAAIGIVMKVSQILVSVVLGLATGILPIISYNYGSKQFDRVKELYRKALIIGTAIMLVSCALVETFPSPIIKIFGDNGSLFMEFAILAMRIYLGATFTVGASIVTGIFFQAIGKSVHATVLSLLRQIVILVPAILILGAVGTVTTVLWAGPIADSLSCIVSLATLAICWKKIFILKKNSKKQSEAVLKTSKQGVVITISREHGSSGKQIGKLVAERLGIPFYYKEMTALAAQESGLDQEFISDINANSPTMLHSLYLSTDVVQQAIIAQDKVIRKIASNGSCVIVGRAADYVLRNSPDVVRIFIYAPEDYRMKRVMEVYGDTIEEAKRNIRKSDEARNAYYKNISGKSWGDRHNYDFLIDSSIGIERCVKAIYDYTLIREAKK